MKYLITGGCGFLGSNLSAEVLKRKEELYIFDNLSRAGSKENLKWISSKGDFEFFNSDIRDRNIISSLIKKLKPQVIFHLAAQVSMMKSLEDPLYDFEVNALGTLNLLEAVRQHSPKAIIIYSSTNKAYGDLEWIRYEETKTRYITPDFPEGFSETIPLDFCTPYGCSKGVADQYVLDYYRVYRLRTVVFRHSSIYGERQFSTYDQGWLGWFCQKAVEVKKGISKKPFIISGNGKQVRDILYIDDAVRLYFKAIEKIKNIKGEVFNIGGGIKNNLSLLELFEILERKLNTRLNYTKITSRKNDQKFFVANIEKAKKLIKWQPKVDKKTGIIRTIEWMGDNL